MTKRQEKDSTFWIQGGTSAEPNVVCLPVSPLNILSLNILYANNFRTNGDCSEIWHTSCPHRRVTIYKKNNLSYFKIVKANYRDIEKEEYPDVMPVVFPAAVKSSKKANNKLKNHVTFGGPDVHKLQEAAGIAGFDNSGSLPESRIKEFEAAEMKASKKP